MYAHVRFVRCVQDRVTVQPTVPEVPCSLINSFMSLMVFAKVASTHERMTCNIMHVFACMR